MQKYSILASFLLLLGLASAYTPYKEFDPYPITVNTTTCPTPNSAAAQATNAQFMTQLNAQWRIFGLDASTMITDKTALFAYAEDYGHIIHTVPLAAFVPKSAADVQKFIQIAQFMSLNPHTKFQIVVRGGSGNVQGATQALCNSRQVLLDTTQLNQIQVGQGFVWAGVGAPYLSVVQALYPSNQRPSVIPDYLALTVGGWMSVGGFGSDSVVYGPGVDQIMAMTIVTPVGIIETVYPGDPFFNNIRGGMGEFGVMISIKLKCVANHPSTQSIHILTANFAAFTASMKNILDNYTPSRVQTMQSFAIPNQELFLEIFIAPPSDLDAVRPNVNAVLATNQTWVYYIELVVRGNDFASFPNKAEVGKWLTSGMDPALIFFANYNTSDWDNRLKLFTVPALVAQGSWYAPKPWTIVAFPDTTAPTFNTWLATQDPLLDIGYGLIAFYPCKTSTFSTSSNLQVPRSSSIFYLTTIGRNEVTGIPAVFDRQVASNRQFWNLMSSKGPASIYASSYIPDFGPADWKKSFGANWENFLINKLIMDPFYIFSDQRNFGFSSLYPTL